ncbi:hypothetical protein ACFLZX_00140 [Nanoarchaeota archaeon]
MGVRDWPFWSWVYGFTPWGKEAIETEGEVIRIHKGLLKLMREEREQFRVIVGILKDANFSKRVIENVDEFITAIEGERLLSKRRTMLIELRDFLLSRKNQVTLLPEHTRRRLMEEFRIIRSLIEEQANFIHALNIDYTKLPRVD